MIKLYIAETFDGFNSLKLEIALHADNDIVLWFPEVSNNLPRTELELKNHLISNFGDKILSLFKERNLLLLTTSQLILNFFRILIVENKLSPDHLMIVFINKDLKRLEFKLDRDARSDHLSTKGFFSILEDDLTILIEGNKNK